MDNYILAYLAGVVDSDGHIGIQRSTNALRNWQKMSPRYWEVITVNQTATEATELFKETFGGLVYPRIFKSGRRKPMWAWTVTGKRASNALHAMRPYLRIKGDQADIVFEFREHMDKRGLHRTNEPGNRAIHRLRPEVIVYRDGLHERLKNLHGISGGRKAKLI